MLNEQQAGPNRIGGEGAPAVAGREEQTKPSRSNKRKGEGMVSSKAPTPEAYLPSFRRSGPPSSPGFAT